MLNFTTMEQDGKKVSFGFSKLSRKPIVIKRPVQTKHKTQLIDCLEGQTIKIKGAQEEKVKGPLVIPIQSSKTIFDHQNEKKVRLQSKLKEESIDDRPDSELTPDELAARELIRDVQNSLKKGEAPKVYSLSSVAVQNTFQVEGKEESTIDDYESIPISEYGLAMLRGMGWNEKKGVGKIPGKIENSGLEPVLRPKGLGLGANKLVNHSKEEQSSNNKNEEELILKKGGYVKIIEGKHKGNYCEVQGFDEDGRIIVKNAVQGLVINLNELLVNPISKEEYSKFSKVINNAKYEEYKKKKMNLVENELETNKSEESNEKKQRSRSKSKTRRYSRSNSRESNRRSQKESKIHKQDKYNYRSSSVDSDAGNHSKQKEYRHDKKSSKHRYSRSSSPDSERAHSKHRERTHREDEHSYRNKSTKKKHRSPSISSTDSDYKKRKERKAAKEHKHKNKKKSKHHKRHKSSSDSDLDHNHARKNYSKHRH